MTPHRSVSLALVFAALSGVPASADVRIAKPLSVRRTDRQPAAPPRATQPPPAKRAAMTSPGARLPLWSGSFVRDGVEYPYTMVGRDPVGNPGTTTVRTLIVPIRFNFAVQGDLPTSTFDACADLVD